MLRRSRSGAGQPRTMKRSNWSRRTILRLSMRGRAGQKTNPRDDRKLRIASAVHSCFLCKASCMAVFFVKHCIFVYGRVAEAESSTANGVEIDSELRSYAPSAHPMRR